MLTHCSFFKKHILYSIFRVVKNLLENWKWFLKNVSNVEYLTFATSFRLIINAAWFEAKLVRIKLYLKPGRQRAMTLRVVVRIQTSSLPPSATQLTHSFDRKLRQTRQNTALLRRRPAWCQCSSRRHRRSGSASRPSSILFTDKTQVTGGQGSGD